MIALDDVTHDVQTIASWVVMRTDSKDDAHKQLVDGGKDWQWMARKMAAEVSPPPPGQQQEAGCFKGCKQSNDSVHLANTQTRTLRTRFRSEPTSDRTESA